LRRRIFPIAATFSLRHVPNAHTESEKMEKEIPSGLLQWVEDYKALRSAGRVKTAILVRDNITRQIKRLKLDAAKVWGIDPDAPKT
jgi:hypothetical protein